MKSTVSIAMLTECRILGVLDVVSKRLKTFRTDKRMQLQASLIKKCKMRFSKTIQRQASLIKKGKMRFSKTIQRQTSLIKKGKMSTNKGKMRFSKLINVYKMQKTTIVLGCSVVW